MRRLVILVFMAVGLAGCGETAGPPLDPGQVRTRMTAHTTRIPADDPESQAIALTQIVYPSTRDDNRPGAIILAPQDPLIAYMAMHRVTHMPVNAPLLYLARDGTISARTMAEMKRLKPEGVMPDRRTQVYLMGDISADAEKRIEELLRYNVRRFHETDPVRLALELDRWQAALKSDHEDEVVVSMLSEEGVAYGLGPMGWNAHMGKGFAWVTENGIPAETRRMLSARLGTPFIYLTGGPDIIPDDIARELGQYGLVRRIQGDSPAAASAVNAGYKDYGRNFGWWVGWNDRAWGWGISQAGHNFIIVSQEDLLGAIPAAVLGHMGKHGPILVVEPGSVPERVRSYLEMVRPFPAGPRETILNHAWIIGGSDTIGDRVQDRIDDLLSVRPAAGGQADRSVSRLGGGS